MLAVKDLKILPKVSKMAEDIGSKEAYQRAEDIFVNATYEEAYAIMQEAEALLKVLLKRSGDVRVGAEMEIIADRGKVVGELASALKIVATLAR